MEVRIESPTNDYSVAVTNLKLLEWNAEGIQLDFDFSDPLEVSQGPRRDNVVMDIKAPELFRSSQN